MPALVPLARERTLPVLDPLAPLLPAGALQRGHAVGCRGADAPSLALALAAGAARAGAWVAAVGLPGLGVEAAAELGVGLDRFVRVDAATGTWADLVAAALDGFEVVLASPPPRLTPGVARRIQGRLQHRGAVLLVVGDGAGLPVDLELRALAGRWEGLGRGHGHLRARRLRVESGGRRQPRPRRTDLWLPAAGGGLDVPVGTTGTGTTGTGTTGTGTTGAPAAVEGTTAGVARRTADGLRTAG